MTGDRRSRSRPDLRERVAGRLLGFVNPLARRMIPAGVPTGAPNILLIVRGRRSGIERTTPVGMLDFDGRWYVQASYGAAGWARNLRAAGEATVIHPGGRRSPVHAIEVPPDEAATILQRALEPYRQLHLLRRLLGPRVRPPVALLRRYRIRVDDMPEDYLADAQRHPLFELRPA
jgi:deazaflavin-dependent oxidoreductase (nitroreductase family)